MTKSKRLKPRRLVVLGFFIVIMAGTGLLMLPVSSATGEHIPFIDSLFMSTSAVCVTGLASIDPGITLSVFGKIILAILIQIGGLGITVIGVIFIVAAGGKFGIGKQRLVKESLNLNSGKGLVEIIKLVAYITITFELVGAVFSSISFSRDFDGLHNLGISVFHSIAAFNNAGFDILGNYQSLTNYHDDIWLCGVTSGLIIVGGLGFSVFSEIIEHKTAKRWSLHTKIVVFMTMLLIIAGTLIMKITEGSNISWVESYFQSVSARTAGFSSIDIGKMSNAGSLILMALMFIGASPGSTGGGIKTVTAFVLFKKIISVIFCRNCNSFHRRISDAAIVKAFTVFFMAFIVTQLNTFIICMLEPDFSLHEILFEVISGFSTTGLSMGITIYLGSLSKLILVITMFIGRLGPLTIATIWLNRDLPGVKYSEEDIMIG